MATLDNYFRSVSQPVVGGGDVCEDVDVSDDDGCGILVASAATQPHAASMYNIEVQPADSNVAACVVRVCAHFRADDVRRAYENAADSDWRPSDTLVFRQAKMSETKTLDALGIGEGTCLFVEGWNDDTEASRRAFKYYCSNAMCGRPVYLKKDDIVKCRSCNTRSVYKPRTVRKCVHIAR
jgi:DNA-directed RNA polymerase subunit RPC12/RpoP